MCTSPQKDSLQSIEAASPDNTARMKQIAMFFKEQREKMGLSEETVIQALGLESIEQLRTYELGLIPIPMDDIFALTNLLNVPPEDVLALIYEVYNRG